MGDGIRRNVLNFWEQPQDEENKDNKLVINGSASQGPDSTFDFEGNVNLNGNIKLDGDFTSNGIVVDFESIVSSLTTGIVSVDGGQPNISTLVGTSDGMTIDVNHGGVAQLVIRDETTSEIIEFFKGRWEPVTGLTVPAPNGLFIVVGELIDGVIVPKVEFNDNNNRLAFHDMGLKIQFGTGSIIGGFIVQFNAAPIWSHGVGETLHRLLISLGANNSKNDPVTVNANPGTLTLTIGAGTHQTNTTGTEFDILVPNFPMTPTFPLALIVLVPGKGLIPPTFSPFNLDPNNFEDFAAITQYLDNGAGGTTCISAGHGLLGGAAVSIVNSINYNGFFPSIFNVVPGSFDIPVPFVGDDAAGIWTSVKPVPNGKFTVQKILALPTIGGILAGYGNVLYQNLSEAEDKYVSAEPFIESGSTSTSIRMLSIAMQQGITDLDNPLTSALFPFNEIA